MIEKESWQLDRLPTFAQIHFVGQGKVSESISRWKTNFRFLMIKHRYQNHSCLVSFLTPGLWLNWTEDWGVWKSAQDVITLFLIPDFRNSSHVSADRYCIWGHYQLCNPTKTKLRFWMLWNSLSAANCKIDIQEKVRCFHVWNECLQLALDHILGLHIHILFIYTQAHAVRICVTRQVIGPSQQQRNLSQNIFVISD